MSSGQATLVLHTRLLNLLPPGSLPCQQSPCRLSVPAGQSIRQAVECLSIRLPAAIIPVVNGVTHDLSYVLQAGDEVQLLVQLSGGAQ